MIHFYITSVSYYTSIGKTIQLHFQTKTPGGVCETLPGVLYGLLDPVSVPNAVLVHKVAVGRRFSPVQGTERLGFTLYVVIPVSVHRIDLPGSGSDHCIKIVPIAFDLLPAGGQLSARFHIIGILVLGIRIPYNLHTSVNGHVIPSAQLEVKYPAGFYIAVSAESIPGAVDISQAITEKPRHRLPGQALRKAR